MADASLALNTALVIRRAIAHAREVASRPHVDADTAAKRVGIFITSFRQEAKGKGVYHLCNRYTWSDIGVLAERGGSLDLQAMVNYANRNLATDQELRLQENNLALQYLGESQKHLDMMHEELKRNCTNLGTLSDHVSSILERSRNGGENQYPDRTASVAGGDKLTARP